MTREDLKGYKYSQKWITEQLNRYEEQREMVLNITSKLDGMPKAYNKPNYALENLMDQYNKLIEILVKDQERQNEILEQIRLVEEPYRTVLTEKYINGKSLEEISVIIHYSYDRTCKMHGTALIKFDELNNKSGQ